MRQPAARSQATHHPPGLRTPSPRPLAAIVALAGAALAACADAGPRPDPAHGPAEVVRFQLQALAEDRDAAGIARAFRFASPANKQRTGPLAHFIAIVRAPDYRPMLNHRHAEGSEVFQHEDYAAQVVSITAADGSRHRYLFELSRQESGALAGCWMTDAVRPLEDEEETEGIAL